MIEIPVIPPCYLTTNQSEESHIPATLTHQLVQFSLVAQSFPTLCDPIDCSTPGFLVHHQLPELIQTHIHQVGDTIQPSHLLSFLSSPTFNLSQPQGLFPWVSSLHQVAKVLEFSASASVLPKNIQERFALGLTVLISLQAKDSQESSPTPQFKSINSLALSIPYSPTLTSIHDYWKNHSEDTSLGTLSCIFLVLLKIINVLYSKK